MSCPTLRALYSPDVLCLVFDEIVEVEEESVETVYADDIIQRERKTLYIALRVSVVCKIWRFTAFKMSQLWTTLPPIVLPLKGTGAMKNAFADCIEELLRRGSPLRGISFDIKFQTGSLSSNCTRVIQSLLQYSTIWRAVSIVAYAIDSFDTFARTSDDLVQLQTLSIVFLPPSNDHRLANLGPFLRHANHLELLDITNAEAVDPNSWTNVPQRQLRTLHITSEKSISSLQINALKQMSIPTVQELYLYTEDTFPATIVNGMLASTPHNIVEMLTLQTKDFRRFNQDAIPTMLRSLPRINSFETTLLSLNDIGTMTNESLAPSLHTVVFNDRSMLRDQHLAQMYGTALRALGEQTRFELLIMHVEHSETIVNSLEGWEETERSRALSIAKSKLADVTRPEPEHSNQIRRALLDIQAIENVNFSDIAGTMIDAKLYKMTEEIRNGDLANENLAIIMEIRHGWADILQSSITCWDPFGTDSDERIALIYNRKAYDAEAVVRAYDEF